MGWHSIAVLPTAFLPGSWFNSPFVPWELPIEPKLRFNRLKCSSKQKFEICPEMLANEIHELYDRHHKVSSNLNSH